MATKNTKKYKGNPVMAEKEIINGKAIITYSQWDLGGKYKVYTLHETDGMLVVDWGCPIHFGTLGEANSYFNKIA